MIITTLDIISGYHLFFMMPLGRSKYPDAAFGSFKGLKVNQKLYSSRSPSFTYLSNKSFHEQQTFKAIKGLTSVDKSDVFYVKI